MDHSPKVAAQTAYNRIVGDFMAVFKERHSDKKEMDAQKLAEDTNHFHKRLARWGLPCPTTNMVTNLKEHQINIITHPEAEAFLETGWVEEGNSENA